MIQQSSPPITVPQGMGTSNAVDASVMDLKSVMFYGAFVATVHVEISPDGTNWIPVGGQYTKAGVYDFQTICQKVRVVVDSYTSGTVQATLAGRYAQGG